MMSIRAEKDANKKAEGLTSAESDPRWSALVARDASCDGAFVYAVSTTGIYCRPGCPSKLAKPENITFFATCAAAEAAGFRACLRCRPDEAPQASHHVAKITAACRMIEVSEELPSLNALARSADLSPFHFHRLFKSMTGVTPKAYGVAQRAKRSRELLASTQTGVSKMIYEAGFNASSRFYEASNSILGMTPSAFRGGGAGAVIKFAIGASSLGLVLVASTQKGICAIFLGADRDLLTQDLQKRFPKAELISGDKDFEAVIAKVAAVVETPALGLDLPLDVQGTAFQQRVWQALRDIPLGETTNYAEIAKRIGAPRATRAVAGACAANKIAVVIPCHRVVRTDGSLSGYRWGVDRKRALLERERKEKLRLVGPQLLNDV